MNLSEMADLVCSKVGKTDDATIALAKKFLKRRHVMLQDAHLWRDSQVTVAITTSRAEITLPQQIDRVLAVRSGGDTNLPPTNAGEIYLLDPTLYEQTGSPAQFIQMSPIALHWTGAGVTPQATQIDVYAGTPSDAGKTVVVKGDPLLGEVDETLTLPSLGAVTTSGSFLYPLSIEKEVTTARVQVAYVWSDYTEYIPADETKVQHVRIKVLPSITESTDFLILCKRRPRLLSSDTDNPIDGSDDALMAFAQGDLLQRMRQYSKAAIAQQEGMAQVEKMKDLERNQSAYSCRIIPLVDSYET